MKEDKEEKNEIEPENSLITQGKPDLDKFLLEINTNISEVRKSDNKKYSILSCILNCFYEKHVKLLPKQIIFDYIKQDIINYKGKMIVSFVDNGTNNKDIVDENNYIRKTYNILSRNKCLVEDYNNQISIDMNFIEEHKNRMFKNLFGKDGQQCPKSKIKKITKRPRFIHNIINKKKENNKNNKYDEDDDYEIEIVENEEEESVDRELQKEGKYTKINSIKKNNKKLNLNHNKISFLDGYNSDDQNIMSKSTIKIQDSIYLEKKRKRKNLNKIQKKEKAEENKKIKEEELSYSKLINKIIDNDENEDDNIYINKDNDINMKKVEIKVEKEILSLIEEGKLFLSLFNDKTLLDELENQNNNIDESDSFVKSILLKYQNEDTLKKYLNILNEDYIEFQNSLKTLIEYKSSLDKSNDNKFLEKFSLMNKIIIKLRQLILEYNFLKKVINNIDANKADIFMKFKNVITNVNKKQEKENYVNDLKNQLQDELCKALVIDTK